MNRQKLKTFIKYAIIFLLIMLLNSSGEKRITSEKVPLGQIFHYAKNALVRCALNPDGL